MQEGSRQGDPLSPLFALGADLLQSIINKAWQLGVLGGDYPIIQYADDTLLIVPADARILFNLKGLLRSFSDSIGLHVNFQSFLVPVNIDPLRAQHLANTFGCQTASMTFTYLGLPLGTQKPSLQEFIPLLTRIKTRLNGISKMLSY